MNDVQRGKTAFVLILSHKKNTQNSSKKKQNQSVNDLIRIITDFVFRT